MNQKTELLKTYVDSSGDTELLRLYQAKLSEVPSLHEILVQGNPMIINDMDVFKNVRENRFD